MRKTNKEGETGKEQKVKTTTEKQPEKPTENSTMDKPTEKSQTQTQSITWKKDFKLSGQINLEPTTNLIGYMSFLRQIQAAEVKGHSEADIIDGVLKAIPSTSRLGGYREDIIKSTKIYNQIILQGENSN